MTGDWETLDTRSQTSDIWLCDEIRVLLDKGIYLLYAPHGATENALKKYQIEQIKAFLEKEGLLK